MTVRPNPSPRGTFPVSDQQTRAESPVLGQAVTYGHFCIPEVGWDFYEEICRQVGFPRVRASEILGHFAGSSDEGWEVIDLWDDANAMERVFSRFLVDAISTTVAGSTNRHDVQPDQHRIARLIVGPAAPEYSEIDADLSRDALAGRGQAPVGVLIERLGGDETDYLRGCELLGFPKFMPQGLVVHLAGPSKDGWRIFDCFDTTDDMRRWHEHVADAIENVAAGASRDPSRVIREITFKRLFVSPDLGGGGYLPS